MRASFIQSFIHSFSHSNCLVTETETATATETINLICRPLKALWQIN